MNNHQFIDCSFNIASIRDELINLTFCNHYKHWD